MSDRKKMTENNIRTGIQVLLDSSKGTLEEIPERAAQYCMSHRDESDIRFRGNFGAPDVHIRPNNGLKKLLGFEYRIRLAPNGTVYAETLEKCYQALKEQGFPVEKVI
ncbi:MAG: hypothetical protein ABIA93_08060 [Candidatus Woesearchaeota archaeon]